MHDPSTVPVTLAAAEAVGYELGDDYRAMTSERRSGDLLPEHLVGPAGPRRRAPRHLPGDQRRSALMAKHRGRGFATIEYPTGHEPERRPQPGLDQAQARRARRRLRRHGRHRPGLEDRPHPDRGRRARRPLRLGDDGQLQHRLVGGVHGHLRLARDVHRRQRRALRGREGARADPRHRLQGARDLRRRPRDRRRRGPGQGRARTARSRSPTWPARRPTSTASSSPATAPRSSRWPRSTTTTARSPSSRTRRSPTPRASSTSRSTTRPARRRC